MEISEQKKQAGRLEETLLDLVAAPSITGTPGEAAIARKIYGTLEALSYFKENPSHLRHVSKRLPDIAEPLPVVFSLVKTAKPTRKTVLLIAHFDIVDIENYGPLKHLAYDPQALGRALKEIDLPPQAKADLNSGDFLFGRGIMDMKMGLALEMDMIRSFSENTSLFDVNIAMLAVGDEENNNGGMRVGAMILEEAAPDLDLDIACVIDTEPSDAGRSGTKNQMIFLGTTGKLLPFFYVLGAPSHAGSYYQGMSAALILSFLNTVIEGNPDLADADRGEILPPPLGLGLGLRNREYSVTLPDRAAAYFNYFFLKKKPADIIAEMKTMGEKAAGLAREHINTSFAAMKEKGYRGSLNEPQVSVITYEELYAEIRQGFKGDLEAHMKTQAQGLDPSLDARDKGIALVEALLALRMHESPVIVTGLLPPFLPPRTSLGQSPKEKQMASAVDALIRHAQTAYGETLDTAVYFAGICDLSYAGSDFESRELDAVAHNIPGWNDIYTIPFQAVAAIDAPVINIGPMGRDAHKMTERLEKEYAFHVLPELLEYFIRQL